MQGMTDPASIRMVKEVIEFAYSRRATTSLDAFRAELSSLSSEKDFCSISSEQVTRVIVEPLFAAVQAHEAARVHHAARRRGGGVAACGARAAAGDAGDRVSRARRRLTRGTIVDCAHFVRA